MYEGKRICLSIGALQVPGIRSKIKAGYTVVAYEPEKEAFAKYQKIKDKNFICFNEAVSDFNGETVLYVDGGNSSITTNRDSYKYKNEYKVKVVSLDSVLESIKFVHILHLNCEGAEIPILMNTSLLNLRKCGRIYVEFHAFAARCRVTDEMVQACVKRLSENFVVKDCHTYHPYYEFLRR